MKPHTICLALLALLLAACAPAAPATLDPRAAGAYFDGVVTADAQATAYQESADEQAFRQSLTLAALPPQYTAIALTQNAAQLASLRDMDNATSTAAVRATESARAAIAIPTFAAATGTALAVYAETDKAKLESARSANNLIGLFALGFIAGLGIGLYWLLGLARADVKRRNHLAEARPEVVGGALVLPPGYTQHPITVAVRALPAPAIPEIEERTIGGQANGKPRFIEVSQAINEHEKLWREVMESALFIFRAHGFSSTDLCGKGRPFASASHWKEVTDRLADNGLILKEHGAPTLIAGEWGDVIGRVQDATRPLKLPKSLPPHLRVFDPQNMQ